MISLALLLTVAAANPPVSLAETPISVLNVSKEVGEFCTEHLAVELGQRKIRVITPREVAALLGVERQRQLLGCDGSSNCMAELGNALGADGLIISDLARLGSKYQLNVRVLRSDTGEPLATFSSSTDREEGLVPLIGQAADTIARALAPKGAAPVVVAEAPPGPDEPRLHRWPWVPTAVAAGLVAVSVVLHLFAASDYSALTNPGASVIPNAERADQLAGRGKALMISAFVGYGLATASLAVAAILFARGEAPVSASVTVSGSGGGVVLGGSF